MHMSAPEHDNRSIRAYFDGTVLWEDCVLERPLCGLSTATAPPSTLHYFIQGLVAQAKPRKLDRKVVGVLLASSLFQLCGSPWLQHGFEGENVLVLPSMAPVSQRDSWRPIVSCDLSSYPNPRSLQEDVAALGVLILELEANLPAGWTDEDEDYETGAKSNRARLSRILKEWKGELPDRYHGVGSACFMFEQLVEDFDHPEIDRSLSNLAVLYKCIVNPLFRQLVSDFGAADRLFQGMPSLCIPRRQNWASTTGRLVLYDDWESPEPDKK